MVICSQIENYETCGAVKSRNFQYKVRVVLGSDQIRLGLFWEYVCNSQFAAARLVKRFNVVKAQYCKLFFPSRSLFFNLTSDAGKLVTLWRSSNKIETGDCSGRRKRKKEREERKK